MNYKIYKFDFQTGIHLGANSLDNTGYTFCADTLFSALCQEAIAMGDDMLQSLVTCVREERLKISDAFPYIGQEYYLPKPMIQINHGNVRGDSKLKKAYKALSYLPISCFEQYLEGQFPESYIKDLDNLGKRLIKTSVRLRGEEEPLPYRVGIYYFNEKNGLYIIVATKDEQSERIINQLLDALSSSGIGGKRSAGLGRFLLKSGKMPELLLHRLNATEQQNMSLSVSMAKEEELAHALTDARYLLVKRSGFVASEKYAPEQQRKKDFYVFSAGSCFQYTFAGDIFDVSSGGAHPVYRYAKPLFMGVE